MIIAASLLWVDSAERIARDFLQATGAPCVYVAYSKNGVTVEETALGLSRVEDRQTFTPKSLVMVGSVSKPLAGFCVQQLVAAGVLDYDTKLGELLPSYAAGTTSPLREATVNDFLAHTSGLSVKFLQDEYMERPEDTPSTWRKGYCLDYLRTPLKFSPGSGFNYAGGLAFVAEMAQTRLKEDFNDTELALLKYRLGLKSVRFGEAQTTPGEGSSTRGYTFEKGSKTLISSSDSWRIKSPRWKAHPSGNLTLSCEDVLKFCSMVSRDFKGQPDVRPPKTGWESVYTPASKHTTYSKSGWATWSGGLWHEGNSGRGELMSVQVNRKQKAAAVMYTNMNYTDNSYNFGDFMSRLLKLAFKD